jgi:hypothetical protein
LLFLIGPQGIRVRRNVGLDAGFFHRDARLLQSKRLVCGQSGRCCALFNQLILCGQDRQFAFHQGRCKGRVIEFDHPVALLHGRAILDDPADLHFPRLTARRPQLFAVHRFDLTAQQYRCDGLPVGLAV